MDIVTFEIKCRKSSKKLGAKTVLFLRAFLRKLLNVFKHSHTKPCLPFFFLTILERSRVHFFISILKFTLGALFIQSLTVFCLDPCMAQEHGRLVRDRDANRKMAVSVWAEEAQRQAAFSPANSPQSGPDGGEEWLSSTACQEACCQGEGVCSTLWHTNRALQPQLRFLVWFSDLVWVGVVYVRLNQSLALGRVFMMMFQPLVLSFLGKENLLPVSSEQAQHYRK